MQSLFQRILGLKRVEDLEPPTRRASLLPTPSPQREDHCRDIILQTNSTFFGKLPLELRLRIYEDVFGGRKVHLIWAAWQWPRGTWTHCVCTVTPSCSFYFWDDWCHKKEMARARHFGSGPQNHRLDIAMLHTCRQAYAEGMSILYSTTTFDFATEPTLHQFRLAISPERFATITSIDLRWHCGQRGQPHLGSIGKENYDALWALLASLPRLRRLRLAVFLPRTPSFDLRENDFDDAWLGPLEKMEVKRTELKKMEVLDIAIPTVYYDRFKRDHEGKQYRLMEIIDGKSVPAQ